MGREVKTEFESAGRRTEMSWCGDDEQGSTSRCCRSTSLPSISTSFLETTTRTETEAERKILSPAMVIPGIRHRKGALTR